MRELREAKNRRESSFSIKDSFCTPATQFSGVSFQFHGEPQTRTMFATAQFRLDTEMGG